MRFWRQRVRELEEENRFLRAKITELERRLLLYENAHTPSSKNKNKPSKKESTGKLGAQEGHPRYERKEAESTGRVEYIEEKCPKCFNKLCNPFKTERIIEEEIPEPRAVEVIEHIVNHYRCPNCKEHIIAKNNAPNGRFGKNVLTHVTLLKFEDRLPLRKTVSSLERHYNISITNVGVFNITNQVSRKLEIPYKELIRGIRDAEVIYVDETELKVNGITYHLWTFVSDSEVIFAIRKSRGKCVLEEILGDKFKGVICCDGWTAYSQYTDNLQRCWAHLLREAKHLAENYAEFKGFYKCLKHMFKKIKKLRVNPSSLNIRKKWKAKLTSDLEQIICQMSAYKEFRKFATKLKNGSPHWFTCIIILLVEPTNNTAERTLRELIVQRKIIGGLRREKGARIMEIITSVIATLKLNSLPLFHSVKSFL